LNQFVAPAAKRYGAEVAVVRQVHVPRAA